MMNRYALITIIILLILMFNCSKIKYLDKDFVYLNFSDSINVNIEKISFHGKSILLNDSVIIYKNSKLIFESHKPKWLFDSTKNKEEVNGKYLYAPDISDVEVPFQLIKTQKTNIFLIIKKSDTLYFDFDDFSKPDFWL